MAGRPWIRVPRPWVLTRDDCRHTSARMAPEHAGPCVDTGVIDLRSPADAACTAGGEAPSSCRQVGVVRGRYRAVVGDGAEGLSTASAGRQAAASRSEQQKASARPPPPAPSLCKKKARSTGEAASVGGARERIARITDRHGCQLEDARRAQATACVRCQRPRVAEAPAVRAALVGCAAARDAVHSRLVERCALAGTCVDRGALGMVQACLAPAPPGARPIASPMACSADTTDFAPAPPPPPLHKAIFAPCTHSRRTPALEVGLPPPRRHRGGGHRRLQRRCGGPRPRPARPPCQRGAPPPRR